MKQLMPFIVIALLIGAVMYVMQDDYEGPDYADVSAEVELGGWNVTYYINDIAKDEPVHGVEATWTEENSGAEALTSFELFIVSTGGSFYFQDLDLDDFSGTVRHEEVCSACEQLDDISGRILINWKDQGETGMAYETFSIEANQ